MKQVSEKILHFQAQNGFSTQVKKEASAVEEVPPIEKRPRYEAVNQASEKIFLKIVLLSTDYFYFSRLFLLSKITILKLE